MDEFLRHTKNALNNLSDYSTIHVAIGNESCDLDSTVSTLVYAFYLNQISQEETTLYLPILNIVRKEYRLRTETTFLLDRHGIPAELLTFESEIDLDAIHDGGKLRITLLDHHVPSRRLSRLSDDIVTVLDHRPREREINVADCVIELVGSCATLVAERILHNQHFTLDSVSASLLCATILTDTINFSPEAGKTTPKDVEMVTRLQTFVPELDSQSLYEEIHTAKFDLSALTAMELLEKDVKMLSGQGLTIAMCSVTMEMKELLQKEHMTERLVEFSEAKSANVIVIMTLTMSPDRLPHRQLAVYSTSRIYRHQIADLLQTSQDPPLRLDPIDLGLKDITVFNQANVQASRKLVLPILKSFLSGEKTPDDSSKLPLDLLSSTNENDFTAVATFTTLLDSVDLATDESSNFFECAETNSVMFTPVPSDTSSGLVPSLASMANKFDSLLVDIENKSSTDSDVNFKDSDSNSNCVDSFSTNTVIMDANTTILSTVIQSALDVNTNGSYANDSSVDTSFTTSPISPDSFELQPQNDNKTVTVLTVGEEENEESVQSEFVDNLISFGDDTFEFTDSELQPSPGHVGFYLSSDSPMEVSSDANSGQGSKVNSYPVTPQNSYMEPGIEQEFIDRSLPSFNNLEMAQRLRASLDEDLVDDGDGDDVGETYTPQNSYSESSVHVLKETEIPCFNRSDMVRRINDKRASLKTSEDINVERNEIETSDAFPWTPYNSMNDAVMEENYKKNISNCAVPEVIGGTKERQGNKSEANSEEGGGISVMSVHGSQAEGSSFQPDRRTDMDKVVHRLSEVGLDVDKNKEMFSEEESSSLDEAGVLRNDDLSSGNVSGSMSEYSDNVVAKQIAQEMMEDKETPDDGTLSRSTASANNVVAQQIAREMISDKSELSEGEKVPECVSTNAVAKQIAEEMIKDKDLLTEDVHFVEKKAVNNILDNVVAKQISEEMRTDKEKITDDWNISEKSKNVNKLTESVPAREIADLMISDVNMVENKNLNNSSISANTYENLLVSSDNVVAKQIAQEIVKDSLDSESSEYSEGANRCGQNCLNNESGTLQSFSNEKRTACAVSENEKDLVSVSEKKGGKSINVVAEDIAEQMIKDEKEATDGIQHYSRKKASGQTVAGESCDQNIKSVADNSTEQSMGDNSFEQCMGGNSIEQSGHIKPMAAKYTEKSVGDNSIEQSMGGNSIEQSDCIKPMAASYTEQSLRDSSVEQLMGGNSNKQFMRGNSNEQSIGNNCSRQTEPGCDTPNSTAAENNHADMMTALTETDLAESAVLEVAFNLSSELIQEALESFSYDVHEKSQHRKEPRAEKKLTKSYNGTDYSIETEYLPEMDPLHGGLDISQDSHVIKTDAEREVVEGASFRKISGQTQSEAHEDILRRMECVAEGDLEAKNVTGQLKLGEESGGNGTESSAVEAGINDEQIESSAGEAKNSSEETENSAGEAGNGAKNRNNNAEGAEIESDHSDLQTGEVGHKIIHVPSDLASSIHESIEGEFDENGESMDLSDYQYQKKVIHLEKEIDFDSSLGTDTSYLSESITDVSYVDKDATETKVKLIYKNPDAKGDNTSDIISKGDNSREFVSKGDNLDVKKEVYMTTAGRISIAVDKDGSRSDSLYSGQDSLGEPMTAEAHHQVGSLILRADHLIARGDEELDVFYPSMEPVVPPPSPSHPVHWSSEKSDGGSSSSQAQNRGHNSDSVSSLEAKVGFYCEICNYLF
ncbi:uncharacterized protein LOC121373106 [Gigantopelta aegis]|uniref:uncharacterized protein LOC121373106 n=1 Tax=Gigantopelta aegis TaxID=1735272 RepID=UPI001B887EFB|nr:uncharacterized protein LOC121373106 [Gigantopelta aegis]